VKIKFDNTNCQGVCLELCVRIKKNVILLRSDKVNRLGWIIRKISKRAKTLWSAFEAKDSLALLVVGYPLALSGYIRYNPCRICYAHAGKIMGRAYEK